MTQDLDNEQSRCPILMIAVGRQRAGKTVVLNTVAQFLKEHGSDVTLWNADQQNVTTNLATFHHDVHEPPTREIADIKVWLDERISDIMVNGYDTILDVGGGETAFTRFSKGMDVTSALREFGIRVVLVDVMAPDPADVDYLEVFLAQGFELEDILIVLNHGLIDSEASTRNAFAPIMAHPVIEDALTRGAHLSVSPALGCMDKIASVGLPYREAVAGKRREGGEPLSAVNRARTAAWWRKEVPAFMASIPPLMLPAMPAVSASGAAAANAAE